MASEANASSSQRCCKMLKELLKPFFGRRAPAPPAQTDLGSTLLEEPVPSCQRELKAVVASPAAAVTTAEAPGQQMLQQMTQVPPQVPQVTQDQQQVAEVAGRAAEPKPASDGALCLMTCLRGLRASKADVQMALQASEEPKNAFFSSAIILGGPSGMQKRPLLCVKVSEQGILCEGSTPFCGVVMLTLQFDQLEETMANWPAQKEQPEYWEEIEKEQKTLKLSWRMCSRVCWGR